jgi:hypothetical protein
MLETTTTTSLKSVFQFPFREPDWQNRFIIGSALIFASFIIPIVPLVFVCGYLVQVMRRAIEEEKLTLPAWDDWGALGINGLRMMVVGLAYSLPGLVIFLAGMGLYFITSFALPLTMIEGGRDAEALFPLLMLGSMAVLFLAMFVGTLAMILGTIPLPMATAHFVAQDELSAAFRLREWWPLLRANKMGYFVAWVLTAGLMAIVYLVFMLAYYSVVLCCFTPILIAPIGFYLYLVGAGLFGLIYRERKQIPAASDTHLDQEDNIEEKENLE